MKTQRYNTAMDITFEEQHDEYMLHHKEIVAKNAKEALAFARTKHFVMPVIGVHWQRHIPKVNGMRVYEVEFTERTIRDWEL